MKIGIVGGSVAGCAVAILLTRAGADVTILERSSGPLIARGAGIILSDPIVQQCIELDLFDTDIPRLPTNLRSFYIKDSADPKYGHKIWQQIFNGCSFNWRDVFYNLRKRISNNDCYQSGAEVCDLQENDGGYRVETVNGKRYQFDMIIAADGINSIIRKLLYPELMLSYTGYIAWRGTTSLSSLVEDELFDQHLPYCVFSGGHQLLYRIPSTDFHKNKSTLLNWLVYEDVSGIPLHELLTDKNGVQHKTSLARGSLSERQINHLQIIANKNLPTQFATIVENTAEPFMQAIFDLHVPQYVKNKICFVGDSAAILRPHSVSGVIKALADAISLAEIFADGDFNNGIKLLSNWSDNQTTIASQQLSLSKSMGEALVTHSPNWQNMNHELMEEWWKTVMRGNSWYTMQSVSANKN